MSSFGRLDVIVLALVLVYLFSVVIHFYYRYGLARRMRRADSAVSKKLIATLNIKVGSLKSIALTAPCLGLAGTCFGILSAFGGVGMEIYSARAMIATRIALALIPTAVAIPVAVLATASFNYFCTRLDLLVAEVFEEGQERDRHFPRARRFPPAERFAELPALGLLLALGLTVLVKVFMPSPSFSFRSPTGFYVELASARCAYDGNERLIILHITGAGEVLLNLERQDWNTLAGRLSEIYKMRKSRTLYLLADSDVSFQTVAYALDAAENADIRVSLITLNADCADRLKPRY